MKTTPFLLLLAVLVVICSAAFCEHKNVPVTPPPIGQVKPDSTHRKVDQIFPWWVAGNKQIWLDMARDWMSDDDSLVVARMCDSLQKKSKIAWQLLPEVKKYGLPDSSIFFEYLDLQSAGIRKDRALALWIDHPMVEVATDGPVCPNDVYGMGRIMGNSALLLLDTKHKKVLQRFDEMAADDGPRGFWAPFVIGEGETYFCSLPDTSTDFEAFGIATVLYPHDLDGDGIAAEFMFYEYEACGVYDCTVIAYDPKRDKLVQRTFHLKVTIPAWESETKKDTVYLEKTKWVYQIPLDSVAPDGRIKYVKDIGHGSAVVFHFDFKFDHKKGYFVGKMDEKGYSE